MRISKMLKVLLSELGKTRSLIILGLFVHSNLRESSCIFSLLGLALLFKIPYFCLPFSLVALNSMELRSNQF